MQHPLSNTPAIITPPLFSPALSDEPGATPLHDTPPDAGAAPSSVSASGAPYAQARRAGLHRALLQQSCRAAAARVAALDLVPHSLAVLRLYPCPSL
jgi:hypothetical protein